MYATALCFRGAAAARANSYGDAADDPGFAGLEGDDAIESRGAITAWFEWQLKGRMELQSLFIGTDCGFCAGSSWKTIESQNF